MRHPFDPTLCLVIGPEDTLGRDPADVAARAIEGGATMVQLRWKNAPRPQAAILAGRLRRLTRETAVAFVVNDDIGLALSSGADGVHVGQSDEPPEAARARLGPHAIVGLSIETMDQLRAADAESVDYFGVGPVLATGTKPDHAPPLGLAGVAAICSEARRPVIAIGGVSAANAAALRRGGADGLAIVSAICGADDPEAAALALKRAFLEGDQSA